MCKDPNDSIAHQSNLSTLAAPPAPAPGNATATTGTTAGTTAGNSTSFFALRGSAYADLLRGLEQYEARVHERGLAAEAAQRSLATQLRRHENDTDGPASAPAGSP